MFSTQVPTNSSALLDKMKDVTLADAEDATIAAAEGTFYFLEAIFEALIGEPPTPTPTHNPRGLRRGAHASHVRPAAIPRKACRGPRAAAYGAASACHRLLL